MLNSYLSLYFIGLSFVIVLCYHFLIPYLKKLKIGQNVRCEGPRSHLEKNGTPTMGGIIIFLTFALILISLFLMLKYKFKTFLYLNDLILLLIPITGYTVIGFLDDFLIIMKKNNIGLKPLYKLLFELLISLIFYIVYLYFSYPTTISIFGIMVDFKFLFGPLIILMFLSTTNSTNLTDGLDGLLTISTLPIVFGFLVLSVQANNIVVTISSIAMLVSLISFLFFNFPKASIFMGDTGSLFIGAYVCVSSILLKVEFLLLIFGFVYIIETISVILQVIYYKKTKGKRLFKMTPIHHHLELCGLNDIQINLIFFIISSVFVTIGLILELVLF